MRHTPFKLCDLNRLRCATWCVLCTSTGQEIKWNAPEIGHFYEIDPDGKWLIAYETEYQNNHALETSNLIDIDTGAVVEQFPYFVIPLPKTNNFLVYKDQTWQIRDKNMSTVCEFTTSSKEANVQNFDDLWHERTFGEGVQGNIQPLLFSHHSSFAIGYDESGGRIWFWDMVNCSISEPTPFFYKLSRIGIDDWVKENLTYGTTKHPDGQLEAAIETTSPAPSQSVTEIIFYASEDEINLRKIEVTDSWLWMTFSPDGYLFVTQGRDSIFYVWGVEKEANSP